MALRRKFTQTKFFRAITALFVLSVLVFFQPKFIVDPLHAAFLSVSWPVEKLFSSLAFETKDFFGFFFSIGTLKSENERLQSENLRLISEQAKWKSVERENDDLRKDIGLLPRSEFDLQAAEVIGRDIAGLGNWISIDRGSQDGIEKGMPVIVGSSILIGRVMETFPESSRVMLLSHPQSVVNAEASSTDARGIVKGDHGLGIFLDMVLQSDTLQTSDKIMTSGLGGDIPSGLLIGTIQNVGFTEDKLFRSE